MFQEKSEEQFKQSAFKKLSLPQPQVIAVDQPIGVANQMMQVINAQNILIMKLLQRQNLLYQELNKRLSSSDSGSRSPVNEPNNREFNNQKNDKNNFKYSSQYSDSSQGSGKNDKNKAHVQVIQSIGQRVELEPKKIDKKQCQPVSQNQNDENNEEQDFVFLEDQRSSHKMEKKKTETKNMIKNFAKGIFNFIKKNRDKTVLVLNSLGMDQDEFMEAFDQLKGKINSLSELRALWIINGSVYNKAFRILSSLYLRKHCLEKTFNSRIQNYKIHMKYRQRLLQGISNPEEFTILKTN